VEPVSFATIHGETYDLCVVGSGPSGLMAAHTASSLGLRVLILERGGLTPTAVAVDRSASATLPYPDPASTRSSALGGTSWRWRLLQLEGSFGARLAFEPAAIERRCATMPMWSLDVDELQDPIQEVLEVLGTRLQLDDLLPKIGSFDPSFQVSHFGFCGSDGIRNLAASIQVLPNVTFLPFSEVVSLRLSGRHVESVLVRRTGSLDKPVPIHANHFVLAGSTIETCRMLFAMQEDNPTFSALDGLGVGISDHPRMRGFSRLAPEMISMIDAGAGGDPVRQLRIEPSQALLDEGNPSASVCFVPNVSPTSVLKVWSAIQSGAAKLDNFGSGHAHHRVSQLIADQLQSRLPAMTRFFQQHGETGYTTDRIPAPGSFQSRDALALVLAEQLPDARNRMRFVRSGRDLPRVELEFGAPFEAETVMRSLDLMTAGLKRRGLVESTRWDPQPTAYSSHHLSGGAAMGGPHAVADSNSKVFGTSNLLVAGLATLPTSGHANPTLLAMGLSCRSVRHEFGLSGITGLASAG
jgi:choline dehydrogenase-like flavoprotein